MRWLASFPILTKIIAGLWIVLTLLYNHNGEFHHAVFANFNHLPQLIQEITELIIVPLSIALGHQWVRPKTP